MLACAKEPQSSVIHGWATGNISERFQQAMGMNKVCYDAAMISLTKEAHEAEKI